MMEVKQNQEMTSNFLNTTVFTSSPTTNCSHSFAPIQAQHQHHSPTFNIVAGYSLTHTMPVAGLSPNQSHISPLCNNSSFPLTTSNTASSTNAIFNHPSAAAVMGASAQYLSHPPHPPLANYFTPSCNGSTTATNASTQQNNRCYPPPPTYFPLDASTTQHNQHNQFNTTPFQFPASTQLHNGPSHTSHHYQSPQHYQRPLTPSYSRSVSRSLSPETRMVYLNRHTQLNHRNSIYTSTLYEDDVEDRERDFVVQHENKNEHICTCGAQNEFKNKFSINEDNGSKHFSYGYSIGENKESSDPVQYDKISKLLPKTVHTNNIDEEFFEFSSIQNNHKNKLFYHQQKNIMEKKKKKLDTENNSNVNYTPFLNNFDSSSAYNNIKNQKNNYANDHHNGDDIFFNNNNNMDLMRDTNGCCNHQANVNSGDDISSSSSSAKNNGSESFVETNTPSVGSYKQTSSTGLTCSPNSSHKQNSAAETCQNQNPILRIEQEDLMTYSQVRSHNNNVLQQQQQRFDYSYGNHPSLKTAIPVHHHQQIQQHNMSPSSLMAAPMVNTNQNYMMTYAGFPQQQSYAVPNSPIYSNHQANTTFIPSHPGHNMPSFVYQNSGSNNNNHKPFTAAGGAAPISTPQHYHQPQQHYHHQPQQMQLQQYQQYQPSTALSMMRQIQEQEIMNNTAAISMAGREMTQQFAGCFQNNYHPVNNNVCSMVQGY